ncbi:Site-specific recombinase XerD [Pseudonocardia oroxyli]|uniref:Site-specific recombinase XerD n=2 Tax=Pseudonocardia oroxyli TaxID=366584 RepID=A0A1G7XBM5_PSEOR|nr:Site-specific recombinase XerD [Pseudonocardia oroxyli]
MTKAVEPPRSVELTTDVETRGARFTTYRARVRWQDPATGQRKSTSKGFRDEDDAQAWLAHITSAARRGLSPDHVERSLADYGEAVMDLALRGLEAKTTVPYRAGWKLRVVPSLGHIPPPMITTGVVDRAARNWIAEGVGRSSVKNSLAVLVRVMEQALRDGLVDRNPARITGWQREYRLAEDELDDPRSLALPDWETLQHLATALVARSARRYAGWGDIVEFAGATAARIGEVSGCRATDIDTRSWLWTVRRQTTPGPGGLIDKGTKGKRARVVPLIEEIRPMLVRRLASARERPDGRVFVGPRGGRVTTAILRDATHWDEVVTQLGHEKLRRHDLRHTGLTWMADAGIPLHQLRLIAGHGSLTTTQRYLHPNRDTVTAAGDLLSAHLNAERADARLRAV